MPYRRLPNTDSARIKALKAAYKKGKELPPFKLAFSQSTFVKVELFINSCQKSQNLPFTFHTGSKHGYHQR